MKKLLNILSVFLALALLAFGTVTWAADGDPVLEPIDPDQIDEVAAGVLGDIATYNDTGPKWEWKTPAELNLLTTSANLGDLADVNLTGTAQGDTIARNGSNQWVNIALGTSGYFWKAGATDPAWAQVTLADINGGAAPASQTYDFGGSSVVVELPNSATPTVTNAGEIALDTTISSHQPLWLYESTGSQDMSIIAIPTADLTTNDGDIIYYNSAGSKFTMGPPSAGNPGSFGSPVDKTLSGDILTAGADNYLEVAGEGAAADDITEIVANAAGDVLVLQRDQGAGYNITVKDGTYIQLQADFVLNHDDDTITLIVETLGANDICKELSRANNG